MPDSHCTSSRSEFQTLVSDITKWVHGRALDAELERNLNTWEPAGGELFARIMSSCRLGIAEGWMCDREAAGIRYGRVIKAGPDTHGFSVDVVQMNDVVGPHHRHPNGEIDLVMPLTDAARFDGRPAGWMVYPPGSAHAPTVTTGSALILYLLPEGAIEFTKRSS